MAPIVSIELLDDELKAVVQAGAYTSKEEAIGHALEVLLAANAPLRIKTAVELYRQETVTLARAAEMAGLELEAFKDQLEMHQVSIPTDETPEEIQAGAAQIRRLRESP
jgi:predicted HTH domain antitoxin